LSIFRLIIFIVILVFYSIFFISLSHLCLIFIKLHLSCNTTSLQARSRKEKEEERRRLHDEEERERVALEPVWSKILPIGSANALMQVRETHRERERGERHREG
jgi:hypothetical protein